MHRYHETDYRSVADQINFKLDNIDLKQWIRTYVVNEHKSFYKQTCIPIFKGWYAGVLRKLMESELHVVPWNHKWYIPICQVWLKLYTWFRQGKHVNSLHLGRQQKQQQGLISKSNLHATWAFISEKNTSFGFDLFLQDLSMLIFFINVTE